MTRMKKMGQKIKKAREAKGMDVIKCANAIGISVNVLECYEGGSLTPREPICRKISEILGIEISYEEYQKASWEDSMDANWNDGKDELGNISRLIGVRWGKGATDEQMEEFYRRFTALNDPHFSDEHNE